MLTGLDHVVILVQDLGRTVGDYEALGFRVTVGGEHADGLTRNALVPFADGTYLELVAFVDPEESRDNVWGWRTFLASGGGLVDWCAASDDLLADAGRAASLPGLAVESSTEGGRRTPDGTEIRWRVARVAQKGRALPFLIQDLTPRHSRVPDGEAARHPNGSTGIRRLLVAAPDSTASEALAHLAGVEPGLEGAVTLGTTTVASVRPEEPAARERFHATGPGPFAVELAGPVVGELDRRLTGGFPLRVG